MQVPFRSCHALLWMMLFFACQEAPTEASLPEVLYVGTFSVRGSKGVYVYAFDRASRSFRQIQQVEGPESPSFLDLHPNGRYLYTANRAGVGTDTLSGSVCAYSIDPQRGTLLEINQTSSYGLSPCHVSVAADGNWVYLSHYAGGSLSVFPLREDGSIGMLLDSIHHRGHGPNPERQEAAHLHSIQSIPDTDLFLAADLGTDRVHFYQQGAEEVKAATPPYIETEPGAGPRHFTLSPDNRLLYIAEELSSTVSVYQLDAVQTPRLQRLSTLPADFSDQNTVADIHLSPDGRHLYVSNRGHHSLAIFAVDPANGQLTSRGHSSSGGKVPRNFLIDPLGTFVLVANQDSDNIILFERDKTSGQLSPTGIQLETPSPVSLQWLDLNQ